VEPGEAGLVRLPLDAVRRAERIHRGLERRCARLELLELLLAKRASGSRATDRESTAWNDDRGDEQENDDGDRSRQRLAETTARPRAGRAAFRPGGTGSVAHRSGSEREAVRGLGALEGRADRVHAPVVIEEDDRAILLLVAVSEADDAERDA